MTAQHTDNNYHILFKTDVLVYSERDNQCQWFFLPNFGISYLQMEATLRKLYFHFLSQ